MLQRTAQSLIRFFRNRFDVRAFHQLEHDLGFGNRHDAAAVLLPDAHIAGQKQPDAKLGLQCTMCQVRIARPENDVGTKLLIELRLQRALYVDLRQDTEALILERVDNPGTCLVERHVAQVRCVAVRRVRRCLEVHTDSPASAEMQVRFHWRP